MAPFPDRFETVTYCYRDQAWIVDGRVGSCGHQDPTPGYEADCKRASIGCFSCHHAGESHPSDCAHCH